jgi:glycosyltransferase involved in cell wall biosynthesis
VTRDVAQRRPAPPASTGPASAAALPPLQCRYLLVIHIPLYIDAQGRRWIDRLWSVDLYRHTEYIHRLSVACPFVRGVPPTDVVPADESALRFVEIAFPQRALAALVRTPLTVWQLARLIGRHDFVHSMYGAWWPFGTYYLVNLVARLRGRCLMVNVEASPWRLARGERPSALRRLKARLAEALNRWTISLADLAVFTHEGYHRDLMPRHAERGHVIHASWVDEASVQDDASAAARWLARRQDGQPALQLLFAGRLTDDKGVRVMLDAMQRLRDEGRVEVRLSIIGAGPLEGLCREHAACSDARVQIDVLAPVAYGPPFLALIRRFDAVIVPSLADEQPRIVYDAYSQAVPVLASATPGLQTCVSEGHQGRLFAPADVAALVETVRWAAQERAELQRMGLAALGSARSMTHQAMHRRRHALIVSALSEHERA